MSTLLVKIDKIVINDQARINGGSNDEFPKLLVCFKYYCHILNLILIFNVKV